MAEGVVGVLIGKLGSALAKEAATYGASLLCKEASALTSLFGEIHDVKDELENMQAYLQEAERFKDTDETTGIFVKKIRGLAFEIEDVVDEFTYKLEDKHGGFTAKMKKRINHVKTWRRLAHKLQDIKQRLEGADKRKARYNMGGIYKDAGGGGGSSNSVDQASYFAREDNLVGIEENKEVLMQWLTDDFEQKRIVATVWGMGGVGKTTLVAHVYNMVKVDFYAAAWIIVSNSYQVEALLKMIAKEFGVRVDVAGMGKRALIEVIHTHLQGKRYILILDDVWGVDVWFNIRDAFPTDCVSRFVITSRIHEVALLATGNCIVGLQPLGEHHSWQLFCKEAFWKDESKTCPQELEPLAWKFVVKCSGLPIAIACIGRLLSCKQPSYSSWESVYKELELQLTNNAILDVNIILKASLEDLPYDLKNCFLHCAMFPEDYLIKRRRVMRHWMTAGFIKAKENKTLEEVAEGYLNELVNRSLLQVAERNEVGRVKCCRMHDVIRLLAHRKADEECFGKVYNGSRASIAIEGTRRISIQFENIEQLSRSGATHLRAIHVFESDINIELLKPILTSSNLLSTLDLQGACIKVLPNEVFDLFNLRFLGLRNTNVENLPEAIGRLQNLEVLDAFDAKLSFLPKNTAKLRKLRYLYACTSGAGEWTVKPWGGVKVPNGIRYLTALWALQCVKASSEFLCEVGALTELRTFGVSDVRSEHTSKLCSAITKMNNLVHLEITALGEKEVLQLEGLCLPQTLCVLGLHGQLEKTSMPQVFSSWSHLSGLTRLILAFSKLDEDSFSSLVSLHGLRHLTLCKAYEGKKLHFPAKSFPKLCFLGIRDSPKLTQVEIEEGAMANLVELVFLVCPELKFLPHGIEHLTALEILRLEETSEELVEKLREKKEPNECNEDLMKISHIRNVTVRLIQKGLWGRIR